MKHLLISLSSIALLVLPISTMAGSSQITWASPESYEDVQLAHLDPDDEELQIRFSRIENHVNRLAEMHFDEGTQLKMTVTDYDMAGMLESNVGMNANPQEREAFMNEHPTLIFNFDLVAGNGDILKSKQEVEVTGRAIRTEGRSRFPHISSRDDFVRAELSMLNRWFAEEFLEN